MFKVPVCHFSFIQQYICGIKLLDNPIPPKLLIIDDRKLYLHLQRSDFRYTLTFQEDLMVKQSEWWT